MVEAAATLPVMLLILVALVNLGFAVYARQRLAKLKENASLQP